MRAHARDYDYGANGSGWSGDALSHQVQYYVKEHVVPTMVGSLYRDQ